MMVQESLTTHRKMAKLLKLSGNNPWCLWWLVELWGYCRKNFTERFDGMTAERLSEICRWGEVEPAQLLTFLVDSGFVRMDGKTLVVHKFEEHNKGLFSARQASILSAQVRAERLSKTSPASAHRSVTVRSANAHRPNTVRQPMNELKNKEEGPLAGERAGRTLKLIGQFENADQQQADPGAVKKFGQLVGGLAEKLRAGKTR